MTVQVFKIYNRVTHSYMVVFAIEASDDEDPNIFVCKDRPPAEETPGSSSCPEDIPEESSSSSEVIEEASSSSEGS